MLWAPCHSLGEASQELVLLPGRAVSSSARRPAPWACPRAQPFLSSLLQKQMSCFSSAAFAGAPLPCSEAATSGTQPSTEATLISLPDEEDADETSSAFTSSSASLLASSRDMLMAVI